jgi:protein-disulfide isomerase
MKSNGVLFNVVVAAVVAAVTAASTSYLVLRYAPLGAESADRGRVEQMMRDYLTKNPEILVEMTKELDERQAAEQSVQEQKAISQNADAIFRSPVSHVAGNPNGDVSVVEFFDYNCPYCRQSLPVVLKLISEDAKVRLVLKELPILSADSVTAAKLALAANKQGKYFEMHQKLFAEPGKADGEGLARRQGAWAGYRTTAKGRGRPRHQESARRGQGPCPEALFEGHASVPDWRQGYLRRTRRPLRPA